METRSHLEKTGMGPDASDKGCFFLSKPLDTAGLSGAAKGLRDLASEHPGHLTHLDSGPLHTNTQALDAPGFSVSGKTRAGQEYEGHSHCTAAVIPIQYTEPIRAVPHWANQKLTIFNPTFEASAGHRTNQKVLLSILHLHVGIANQKHSF